MTDALCAHMLGQDPLNTTHSEHEKGLSAQRALSYMESSKGQDIKQHYRG